MKICFSGSRSINDIDSVIDAIEWRPAIDEIIVGDCYGADALVQKVAEEKGMDITVYGISAIPRNCVMTAKYKRIYGSYTERDRRMINDADICIMLWDGISPGTKRNIEQAKIQKIPYIIIKR